MHADRRDFGLIVIGSGMGGLTVASLMAQLRQQRVLVLERHFKLGGFTHSFARPGHGSWDVGLHYVGGMDPSEMTRRVFDLVTGGGVQWKKMSSPFEKFVYPDFTFEVPDDEASYRAALVAKFPEERAAIEQYFVDLRRAAGWMGTRFVLQALPSGVAALMRLITKTGERLALSTTASYLNTRIHDQRLRAVLASQWGDYGLPPSQSAFGLHAMVTSSYLRGGYYPIGGAGLIAASVERIVTAHGGRCLPDRTVTEIIVENGRAVGVKTDDGEFFAPTIVSDAGAWTTFCRLLPATVPIPFRDDLERRAAGNSFVSLYLGFKRDPRTLGFHGENHWIYDGYDHDALFSRRRDVVDGCPHACYLSLQSLKDPSAATPVGQILALLDYADVDAWKTERWRHRGAEYDALKRRIADGLLAFVDRRYPGFRDLVDYCEVSTPLTVEGFTGHPHGAVYGVPGTPDRYRLAYLGVRTPVRNLYLTGSDAGSLGIVGALMSGVMTAARVQGVLGLFRIFASASSARPQPALSRLSANRL